MNKYHVKISYNYKSIFTANVEAKDEPEAIQKTMIEADNKNIKLPEEFWCKITKI